jgi:hypothetical protein
MKKKSLDEEEKRMELPCFVFYIYIKCKKYIDKKCNIAGNQQINCTGIYKKQGTDSLETQGTNSQR